MIDLIKILDLMSWLVSSGSEDGYVDVSVRYGDKTDITEEVIITFNKEYFHRKIETND